MFKILKKADIVLFATLMIIGISLSVLSFKSATPAKSVVVTVDGELYGTYDIEENQTIKVTENNHTNKITIKDGRVQMSYSDCKNQVCVKDGSISKTNHTIVCLPNKVMIEITGGEEEIDAVSN